MPRERSQLFSRTVAPAAIFPAPSTVVDLIEAQAASSPDRIAIDGPGGRLTYRQLEGEVKLLAASLHAAGARGGARIGVCLERSPGMIVALLAVLRTGAAYVPIDPRLPDDQIDFILQDTEPLAVVGEGTLRSRFGEGRSGSRLICLDEITS